MEPEPEKRPVRSSSRKFLDNLENESEESDVDSEYKLSLKDEESSSCIEDLLDGSDSETDRKEEETRSLAITQNGNTIIIPVQQITESEDSDIEILAELVPAEAPGRLTCSYCHSCNFLDKEAYHTHLCLKHFYKDLLDKFTNDNGAGTGRIAETGETGGIGKTGDTGGAGGAILKCPKTGCICKFKNPERAVIHLGCKHVEFLSTLIEKRNLTRATSRMKEQEKVGIPFPEIVKIQEDRKERLKARRVMDDDIVEISKTFKRCMFCNQQFTGQQALYTHLAFKHLTPRLERELEEAGCEMEEEYCRNCKKAVKSMVLHWGLEHGGIERAKAKFSGKRNSYIRMKSAKCVISGYIIKKSRRIPRVFIKSNPALSKISQVYLADRKRSEESIGLYMEVESEDIMEREDVMVESEDIMESEDVMVESEDIMESEDVMVESEDVEVEGEDVEADLEKEKFLFPPLQILPDIYEITTVESERKSENKGSMSGDVVNTNDEKLESELSELETSIQTNNEEMKGIKVTDQETEQIKTVDQETEEIKTVDREIEQIKTVDQEIEQIKTVDREIEQIKTVHQETEQIKSVDDKIEQIKTVNQETEQIKTVNQETEQIKSVDQEIEQIKTVDQEPEQIETVKLETNQIKTVELETEKIKMNDPEAGNVKTDQQIEQIMCANLPDKAEENDEEVLEINVQCEEPDLINTSLQAAEKNESKDIDEIEQKEKILEKLPNLGNAEFKKMSITEEYQKSKKEEEDTVIPVVESVPEVSSNENTENPSLSVNPEIIPLKENPEIIQNPSQPNTTKATLDEVEFPVGEGVVEITIKPTSSNPLPSAQKTQTDKNLGLSTQNTYSKIKISGKKSSPANVRVSAPTQPSAALNPEPVSAADDDDEIQVIFHNRQTPPLSVNRGPGARKSGIKLELAELAKEFISGNVPKSRSLENVENNMKRAVKIAESSSRKSSSKMEDIQILSQKHRSSEPVESCCICSQGFSDLKSFHSHLALIHFKENLQKRIYKDSSSYNPAQVEWKCPTCKMFVSSDLDKVVEHFGAICLPIPVKGLYLEYNMKSKESKPDLSCVFCDDNVQREDLINHISSTHIEKVKYSMGMVWSFNIAGSLDTSCPICRRVEPFSTNGLVEHFLREHTVEFSYSLEKYREALKESRDYECLLCGCCFNEAKECVEHLVLNHFMDQLISECGLSQDGQYACSNCEFRCNDIQSTVLHYGIEHQRLNFWFTDRLLTMASKGEISIEGGIEKPKIDSTDVQKLAEYLSPGAGLKEELSARDTFLNPAHEVYKRCLNLIIKTTEGTFKCIICDLTLQSEMLMVSHIAGRPHLFGRDYAGLLVAQETRLLTCKLCLKKYRKNSELEKHLTDIHLHDDILLQALTYPNLPGKMFCEECGSIEGMNKAQFIDHMNKVHRTFWKLYTRIQVTPQSLNCKLCSITVFTLTAFKHHLGCHFPVEMNSCVRIVGSEKHCLLCERQFASVHDNYDIARHVAVKHNYLENLYAEEVKSGVMNAASNELYCELCEFSTLRMPHLLFHITDCHVKPVSKSFFNESQTTCTTCKLSLPSFEEFLSHVGEAEDNCNYSLYCYFKIVDDMFGVQTHTQLSFDDYYQRIRKSGKKTVRKSPALFPSVFINQKDSVDFIEDPVSSKITLEINSYEGYVTVEFEKKLPMKSFKSSKKFENEEPSCIFCPLHRGHWEPPEGDSRAVKDAFLIHLANTHFKTELMRMFACSNSSGDFICCGETMNFQNLIGHIKEAHSVIMNMYKAVVPTQLPNTTFNNLDHGDIPQYVSHLMPWLPKSSMNIKKIHNSTAGLSCKLCNQRILGNKMDLNKHYVLAHFQFQMETKYIRSQKGSPYRCPEPSCVFVTRNNTTQKEELFMHLANKHNVMESFLTYSLNTVRKEAEPSLKFIKPGVSIKLEPENPSLFSTTTFIHPQPYQCLTCHRDLSSVFNLLQHMKTSRHVNISWAIKSNTSSAVKSEKPSGQSIAGRWFQKLDVNYRCSPCLKKVGSSLSGSNFQSLEEVFVHICSLHKDYFEQNYTKTVLSFSLCKICNGFIDFQGLESEKEKKKAEFEHYILHTHLFIQEMGIMKKKMTHYICSLCNCLLKSKEYCITHLRSQHREQILQSFREFEIGDCNPVKHCSVCKKDDISLEHLSLHSRKVLMSMGLIEPGITDHKSSRASCRCCGFVAKTCCKILEHFATAHTKLFLFIREKFDAQNEPIEQNIAVNVNPSRPKMISLLPNQSKSPGQISLLKNTMSGDSNKFQYTCELCPGKIRFATNILSLKKHLIQVHFYTDILDHINEVGRTRIVCPDCGEYLAEQTVDVHYWIHHIVGKGLEVVEPPKEEGGFLICNLCSNRSKDKANYYAHMFFIHNHDESREAVRIRVKEEQEKRKYVFCPEKGCKTKNEVEKDSVLHYAIDHGYLEVYLKTTNQLYILNKKDSVAETSVKVEDQNISENVTETKEVWKTVLNCPICLKLFKGTQFQRAAHFLDHFRQDIYLYLRMKYRKANSLRECCGIIFNDDPTFFMHFGEHHNLFDQFIKEKCKQSPMNFNNEFTRFLDKRSTSRDPRVALQKPSSTARSVPVLQDTSNMTYEESNCFSLDLNKMPVKPSLVKKKQDWKTERNCVICTDKKFRKDESKRYHYIDHFKEDLEIICKEYLDKQDLHEMLICPLCNVQIIKGNDSNNLMILKFFCHIGFVHEVVPNLFLQEFRFQVKINSATELEKSLSDRFWAIKAGICMICKSDLSGVPRSERLDHYANHFKTLHSKFPPSQSSYECYKCGVNQKNLFVYKLHLLNDHFTNSLARNLKVKPNKDFQCGHCQTTSTSPIDIVVHLVNVEMMLDVQILGDLETPSSNLEFPETTIEPEKKFKVEPTLKKVPGISDPVECKICHKFMRDEEFFRKHLYKKHFTAQIDDMIPIFFDDFNDDSLPSHQCKSCHQWVMWKNMGVHIADAHEDVRKMYLELIPKQPVESNELTTLGEDGEDAEKEEKERRRFLKSKKKTQEPFTQNSPCYMFGDKLPPCHECKKIQLGANYAQSGTCCCFEGFRKIRYLEDGRLIIVGYLDPVIDPKPTDREIWDPKPETVLDNEMSLEEAFFIVKKVGDLLCDIIVDEKLMKDEFVKANRTVVWKRPHIGVREMCDVCSTSIYNLHFTCSRCGVLVCCDCFLARKKGTKYKSINVMAKPSRSRRFRPGLDMNLWPLCLNNQIHDIDKLCMTQMSPENVPESLVSAIHEIRKFYNLKLDCKCCNTPKSLLKFQNSSETAESSSLQLFTHCPECNISFANLNLNCIRVHLVHHLKNSFIEEESTICQECNIDLGNLNNALAHQALLHRVVDIHYETVFISEESRRQDEVSLEIDEHDVCQVCVQNISQLDKAKKRTHYIYHLAEILLNNTKALPPFCCEECTHQEFNRSRLMVHVGVYHKKLDSCLKQYLTEESNTSMNTLNSWLDIPNCLYCNEKHEALTPSQKRNHYITVHLKEALENEINKKNGNLLQKNPPYRCRMKGCQFVVDSSNAKARFLSHMGATHRMVDLFLMDATKTMVQPESTETNADLFATFSGKCQMCDEELDSSGSESAVKAAKAHYHIHFKNSIEEKYEDLFLESRFPLFCPFEGCEFNTSDLDSDQFGHHKKKLVKHLGSFHDLFKNFVTQGMEGRIRKNYEMSDRFSQDTNCKICFLPLPVEYTKKTIHFFEHFKQVMGKEYEKEIMGDGVSLKCPFCDAGSHLKIKEESFQEICIHIGVNHGVFDQKLEEYSQSLDYNSESKCRICSQDFHHALAKATSLKKHYAEHFAEVIENEFPQISSGVCPICNKKIIIKDHLIIHIGTKHGYFCRLIDKHHWKEEEEDIADDINKDPERAVSDEMLVSEYLCIICGFKVKGDAKEKKVLVLMGSHVISHIVHLIPGYSGRKCQDCGQVSKNRAEFHSHLISHTSNMNILQALFSQSRQVEGDVTKFFQVCIPEYEHPTYNCINEISLDVESEDTQIQETNSVPFHATLASCFKCKCNFTSVDSLAVKLHLVRHFIKCVAETLPLTSPFQCPTCRLNFSNRFSLLIHCGFAHDTVDKLAKEAFDSEVTLPDKLEERASKESINRYTLPIKANRYKSTCLLCGTDDVRLASLDRINQEEEGNQGQILINGLGYHLLKMHLWEYFPHLYSPVKECFECNETFSNNDNLAHHFVKVHSDKVLVVLNKILYGPSTPDQNLVYSDLFVGFENEGFTDFISLDKTIVTSVGIVRDTEVCQETVLEADTACKPAQAVMPDESKTLISLRNLKECHILEDNWFCDICGMNFSSPDPTLNCYNWNVHIVCHLQEKLDTIIGKRTGCETCSLRDMDKPSFRLHLAFVHGEAQAELYSQVSMNTPSLSSLEMKIKKNTEEKKSLKRKIDLIPELSPKRKKSEDKSKNFIKSVKCDICNINISLKKEADHVMKHVADDLRKGLKSSTECSKCDQTFADMNELIHHVGIFHNHAMSIYKRFEYRMLAGKKKLFFEQLAKKIPPECYLCGLKFSKGQEHLAPPNYWKHLLTEHADLFKFLKTPQCNLCQIQIVDVKSSYAILSHYFVEHEEEVNQIMMFDPVEEWKTLGRNTCELCPSNPTFSSPFGKRRHLAEKHFIKILSDKILVIDKEYLCPSLGCNYKSALSDASVHLGIIHKEVDQHLASKIISERNPEKVDKQGVMCVLCSEPVENTEIFSHLISHFFAGLMVDNLFKTSCADCKLNLYTTQNSSVYGQLLNHIGEKHFSSISRKFLEPAVKKMIGSPLRNLEFQNKMVRMLMSKDCIYCNQCLSPDPISHIQQHHIISFDSQIPDSEPHQCDLCDGFPCFQSYQELKAHNAKEHYSKIDIYGDLSLLISPQIINEKRSIMQIKPLTSSTKRKHELDPEHEEKKRGRIECLVEGCEGFNVGQYYQHMTEHYQESVARDLNLEMESQNQSNRVPLACPRCIFVGETTKELIEHFGEYHRVTELYVKLAQGWIPEQVLVDPDQKPGLLPAQGRVCSICGQVKMAGLSDHWMAHVQLNLQGLPTHQPYICGICLYESGSRLGIIRHTAQFHPQALTSQDRIWKPRSSRQVEPGEQNPNLTLFQVKAKYKETQPCSSPPSLEFNNLMKTEIRSSLALPLSDISVVDSDTDSDKEENKCLRISDHLENIVSEDRTPSGVSNDNPSEDCIDEPGLTTLYPRKIQTNQEAARISVQARHAWLCDGRLLHLYDAISPHNIHLFKHQWSRGQPVIISNSDQNLNKRLWSPKSFMRDFEDKSSDLINTLTGRTVPKQPLKWFWSGFSSVSQRLVDEDGTPMLLKLKDWPPDGDIAENLPKRYEDLIKNFPIPSYTLREGKLNLASYMPDWFLKPELGPKMYIAYGNALYSARASTNLHLDMSDAVNLLVYVGLPDDCDPKENIQCVLEQVDEAGCDLIMKRRIRSEGLLPGAIWHIFHPGDTNKIRDFLVKVALEKGKKLDPHDDPIHDQSTYLDSKLRMRLYKEYGVHGYTIIQCAGDTVFIPAGACHQVRNLHNCIKIAEDFVSPELANNCLHLTQEFRHLTEHHTNHEDKLQIKNIIYHSVKNAVARINKQMDEDKKKTNKEERN